MIKSMTGYGKSVIAIQHQKLMVEIRTLNSKQLDINLRIPQMFREKEIELRTFLRERLQRGKVDFSISGEQSGKAGGPVLNKTLAYHYFTQLKEFAGEIGREDKEDYLAIIMRLPDVFTVAEETIDKNDWDIILQAVADAVDQVSQFRSHEGSVLEEDFRQRIATILQLLGGVDKYELSRIDRVRERIVKSLNENLPDIQYDRNRLEQELIYYLEKLDVTEEKIRLKKHCDYFLEVLGSEETVGRKLAFVLQEIGREINTLGSKANDADMQKIVVLMKDELEKIKEQMLNIL
ncbi:MAG: hypothetical protein IEMM0006_2122 [bacterium]|nr:MAG: hypothetical protein IEMM0006_2122 [bacterium]